MNDVEIEIQVNIENSKPLMDFLEKNGQFKKEIHQIDEYFSPPHRNFIGVRPVKEWLRLRNSDGEYSINYKNLYFDKEERSYHRDEYETKIKDLTRLRKILDALNFKPLIKVDKVRKVWKYKDYEIALDRVNDLGDFVEIEYIGKNKKVNSVRKIRFSNGVNPKKITEGMISFLKNLGCGKIKRNYVGYPFQLLFPKEVKYEDQ